MIILTSSQYLVWWFKNIILTSPWWHPASVLARREDQKKRWQNCSRSPSCSHLIHVLVFTDFQILTPIFELSSTKFKPIYSNFGFQNLRWLYVCLISIYVGLLYLPPALSFEQLSCLGCSDFMWTLAFFILEMRLVNKINNVTKLKVIW